MAFPFKGTSNPQPSKNTSKPVPSQPKDSSLFRGRPHIERHEVRGWLKGNDAFRISGGIPEQQRIALEKKLFPKGQFVTKKDAEKTFRTLKDYPEKSKKEFGVNNDTERRKALNVVRQILGK